MWELDYKESCVPKNWCFWTVVLEKTLESPLDCKEIQPVHPKGNQSWIFIGRTDAEASILWPPDAKNWVIRKDPDAGKDWGQEKGTTEDEMVGWHHRLNGHEFEQTLGDGDGQGGLACCSPWGHKEPDRATEQQQQNIYLDKRKLKKKPRSLRWRKPNITNIKTKTSWHLTERLEPSNSRRLRSHGSDNPPALTLLPDDS